MDLLLLEFKEKIKNRLDIVSAGRITLESGWKNPICEFSLIFNDCD